MQKQNIAEKIGTFAIDQQVVCVLYRDENTSPEEFATHNPTLHKRDSTAFAGRPEPAADPPWASGWNWGAFLLTWIWGMGNKVPRALWAALPLPVVWPVMAIWLGFNGNRLAWEAKTWDEPEHFEDVQSAWSSLGVVAYAAAGAIVAIMAMTGLFAGGRPQSQLDLAGSSQVNAATPPVGLAPQPSSPTSKVFSIQAPAGWEVDEPQPDTLETYSPHQDGEGRGQQSRLVVSRADALGFEGALDTLKQEAIKAGGLLTTQKDLSIPEQSRALLVYKFVDAKSSQISYRQLFVASDGRQVVRGTTEVPELKWTRHEGVFEKALLSVKF